MSIVMARNYGRAGNVFFQVGMAIAYSLKNNLDLNVQSWTNDKKWNPLYLQGLVNQNWVQGVEDVLINENGFRYQDIEFKEDWRGKQIVLNGYFQSWRYVEDYRSEILYLFGLPYEMKDGYVSIHVRRGDYLVLTDKHIVPNVEWYEKAMAMFPDYKFKFFSDEIEWCKKEFGHREDCEFSTNTNELEDLIEASQCEHNINSSSTFSWWISWLNRNPNKKCIFPEKWFVDGYHLDTTDLLHPSWIKL